MHEHRLYLQAVVIKRYLEGTIANDPKVQKLLELAEKEFHHVDKPETVAELPCPYSGCECRVKPAKVIVK